MRYLSKGDTIESFAREKKTFHPILRNFLIEFFSEKVLNGARIVIMKKKDIISGRAKSRAKMNQNNKSPSKTPALVLLNRMYFGNGVLNKPGYHTGNTFDLSTPEGMATFMHEIFHVHQWYRDRVLLLLKYIKAVFLSLIKSKILWDHHVIDFEVEAIEFERKMKEKLSEKEYLKQLSIFKDL